MSRTLGLKVATRPHECQNPFGTRSDSERLCGEVVALEQTVGAGTLDRLGPVSNRIPQ